MHPIMSRPRETKPPRAASARHKEDTEDGWILSPGSSPAECDERTRKNTAWEEREERRSIIFFHFFIRRLMARSIQQRTKQTNSRTGEWRMNKKRHILGRYKWFLDIYTTLPYTATYYFFSPRSKRQRKAGGVIYSFILFFSLWPCLVYDTHEE